LTNRRNQEVPTTPPVDQQLVDRAVEDVRRKLKQAGRPGVAAQLRKTLGDNVACYGVQPAAVKDIGLEIIRRHRTGGLPVAMAIGDPLFMSGNFEEGQVAAQVVGTMGRHVSGADFDKFDAWAEALTTAQVSDALGTSCLSPVLAAKPSLALRLVDWAKSPNRWRRRAAVSGFVPLVREGRFMTDALSVAAIVMQDDDEEVQRGVGNLLLEASRLKADRVVEFLQEWKDKSPKLILQIAATKLSPTDRVSVMGS
jgi:3-methyladenine DNA glycosylase AlkD